MKGHPLAKGDRVDTLNFLEDAGIGLPIVSSHGEFGRLRTKCPCRTTQQAETSQQVLLQFLHGLFL
jgi:hypothetical protein